MALLVAVMTRTSLLAVALLALSACGHTDLTARGEVTATFEGTSTGLRFNNDTRLEAPEGDASLGLITGNCEMARVADAEGEAAWGIVVDLRRGGSVEDNGLSSVTIMQRTDTAPDQGRIEAELGMASFTTAAGTCGIDVPYASEDSGLVGLSGTCEVQDAEANVATITVELDIVGCTVVD